LLARHGFTSSPRALEAPRGLLQVFSEKTDWNEITKNLGETWEIALNTYKPFACGIVNHPSIDGCIQFRNLGITTDKVKSISLKVHSLVLELCGKKSPKTGLEGKFSVYHSCAVGFIFGEAGEHQYTDAIVQDPQVIQLRDRVQATVDHSIPEDAAELTLQTIDGKTHYIRIDHAIGSLERPLSNAELRAKFIGQAGPAIGEKLAQQAFERAMTVSGQHRDISFYE